MMVLVNLFDLVVICVDFFIFKCIMWGGNLLVYLDFGVIL